jgi:hypothetical protein
MSYEPTSVKRYPVSTAKYMEVLSRMICQDHHQMTESIDSTSLTETLDDDNNRRDKASMMNSYLEFVVHMEKAEKGVKNKDLGGAEAHRLIAESIHKTLTTFEAIKELATEQAVLITTSK